MSLIRNHSRSKAVYERAAEYEQERITVLKEYVRELRKPGFKTPGYIKVGNSWHGDVVITASDTFTGE